MWRAQKRISGLWEMEPNILDSLESPFLEKFSFFLERIEWNSKTFIRFWWVGSKQIKLLMLKYDEHHTRLSRLLDQKNFVRYLSIGIMILRKIRKCVLFSLMDPSHLLWFLQFILQRTFKLTFLEVKRKSINPSGSNLELNNFPISPHLRTFSFQDHLERESITLFWPPYISVPKNFFRSTFSSLFNKNILTLNQNFHHPLFSVYN